MFIALEKIMPAMGISTWGLYQGARCITPWVMTTRVKTPPMTIDSRVSPNSGMAGPGRESSVIQLAASSIRDNTPVIR